MIHRVWLTIGLILILILLIQVIMYYGWLTESQLAWAMAIIGFLAGVNGLYRCLSKTQSNEIE